jgi:tRNA G18 (ribose-2'-O)-methylase SpoU
MLHVHSIASLDAPELAPYRNLRRSADQERARMVVAQGEKIVRSLLRSQCQMISLLVTKEWLHELEPLWQPKPEEIHAYIAGKKTLETLVGHSMYQGVMAMGRIPDPEPLDTILERSPRPWLLVAVDRIDNSENMGVIVRNCGAFGVQALLQGEKSCSPYLTRAVRTSMGAIFTLPVLQPTSLAALLPELRSHGIRCVAAHAHTNAKTLAQADLAGDCCIVLGNENSGISEPVMQACDETVAIPMEPGIDSLNVGSASAVFFYEASRQRGKM